MKFSKLTGFTMYELTPFTGAGGIGDRSVHIKAGRIDRDIVQSPIDLDPAHLSAANDRYQTVRAVLAARCLCPTDE